jgi:hypothetical protein
MRSPRAGSRIGDALDKEAVLVAWGIICTSLDIADTWLLMKGVQDCPIYPLCRILLRVTRQQHGEEDVKVSYGTSCGFEKSVARHEINVGCSESKPP